MAAFFFLAALFTLYSSKRALTVTNTEFPYSSSGAAQVQVLTVNDQNQRFVVIGDVHGCTESLDRLIEKLDLGETDKVIFAGDLVAKGPDTHGVLRRAKELNALCVRGNNDDEVLRWRQYIRLVGEENIDKKNLPKGLSFGEHQELASTLPEELLDYLESCPVILSIPQYDLLVVHGGMDPARSIEAQDEYVVMNIRNILDNGDPTRRTSPGTSWSKVWERAQEKSDHPITVVYGHAAARGLKIRKYSKGLDTGCYKGDRLTAMSFPSQDLTDVKCHKHSL
ncbi:Metallo-dependent phosphatase [Basidiobolus meristosporus CBS 931.73]|uniref:Metallo-dependent phosphatase n=1 Tax=Basidiobolus meristosporus CBS 931.73 TaxID=1314790 RepID=A0A1Y1XY80_9FUNG|nr:Metallo-dependent phosphatase [Basidiobolus meristosporus CBS 931.73]|eukprot:ORX90692.1 Metallo-dependent phosphatase [Basidiobolus meristosporus CBS 931.73]